MKNPHHQARITWLNRYQSAAQEIADLEGQLTAYQTQMAAILGTITTRMAHLARIQADIQSAIDALPDPHYQAVLRKRYLSRQNWEAIATDLHYSRTQTYHHHQCALAALTLPQDPKTP